MLILLSTGVLAQNYPKNYFIAPLDTPLLLTGTFGEVRNDHFHSGIDISTGEQEGLPVKAAADGYVSRIKISADGFGRVLYVTHPNNYVTVYGHLKSFRADLQNYTIS
ncbi:MAG: M23 family metallopeptidase, partial [bacterium]